MKLVKLQDHPSVSKWPGVLWQKTGNVIRLSICANAILNDPYCDKSLFDLLGKKHCWIDMYPCTVQWDTAHDLQWSPIHLVRSLHRLDTKIGSIQFWQRYFKTIEPVAQLRGEINIRSRYYRQIVKNIVKNNRSVRESALWPRHSSCQHACNTNHFFYLSLFSASLRKICLALIAWSRATSRKHFKL
jgi:hypothetical protein